MGGLAAAEESVSLVDSGDNRVVAWMANTAEAMASWLAETAEGEDSIGVSSWVVETASASHCGRRRQHRRCIVGGEDSGGVASWVMETAEATA